ncbi:PadR family transcriptional regulator [Planomonospora venezuelensis]|uniref:DNA-binding PadR family transcriptional regulator n=1 Tax=Planomonospora venezuelensis TaxID=1999 RepID=A0A841D2D1_PLAVE|nr:PadR family transcriptional regulator [Planomonospora venezuelensis]MBB5962548.1 DNA-binding PadR family transcriptional regulator [Planomonospora venezuelensis]GIM99046.1 PadR family transcriptional regulator [Planomonospora venezuelensis]
MTRGRGNPLALAVLALLFERPMHPYEMASTMRARRKEESIKLNYGSLYSVVESLVKRGLIEATEVVREGRRPERTVYTITEPGRLELYDWLSELISMPAREYTSFEAGLSLIGVLSPDDVMSLLEERVLRLEQQLHMEEALRELAAKHDFPRLLLIEGEYVMMLRRAELGWVRGLLDELREGTLEGLDDWRVWHERCVARTGPSVPGAPGGDDSEAPFP